MVKQKAKRPKQKDYLPCLVIPIAQRGIFYNMHIEENGEEDISLSLNMTTGVLFKAG